MKSIKRIIGLFIFTVSVILFWLVLGINKAGDESYTRIYEDTSKPAVSPVLVSGPGKPKKGKSKQAKTISEKKYKKESIKAGAKLSDLEASMFSRAIHFERELIIAQDSIP